MFRYVWRMVTLEETNCVPILTRWSYDTPGDFNTVESNINELLFFEDWLTHIIKFQRISNFKRTLLTETDQDKKTRF